MYQYHDVLISFARFLRETSCLVKINVVEFLLVVDTVYPCENVAVPGGGDPDVIIIVITSLVEWLFLC